LKSSIHILYVEGSWNQTIKIDDDHAESPAEEIAQVICQIAVNPVDQRRMGEVTIHSERDFPHEKISDRIHSVSVDQAIRLHYILKRFGHLFTLDRPPSVGKYHFWRSQTNGLEHGWPINRVSGEDVLADEVSRFRPELIERIFF
jgi:hypothetical protein